MKNRVVSVIGLGYVGLPVAVAFGEKYRTLGFDINSRRIAELKSGTDRTQEVGPETLRACAIEFTDRVEDLRAATFHIVAVPTPVDAAKRPDMSLVIRASEMLGPVLKPGDVIVYESTVYPGATEEDCVPALEKTSGLKCGRDFFVGYSPERINPGDKKHVFKKITKVVSGQNAETLKTVAEMYGSVIEAEVYTASSIKVAEAAKVIENTQRDINIALMNELAMIFQKMGIDTQEVLKAAGTKWNFLPFTPGLVGGHCIGVDPYYLTYKAESFGYHPQVILSGRRINDGIGKFVAEQAVKWALREGRAIQGATATVLGFTFKENISDIRNTRVLDIVRELESYGMDVQVWDPHADPEETRNEYGLRLSQFSDMRPASVVIAAVGHREIVEIRPEQMSKLFTPGHRPVLMDVKSIFDRSEYEKAGFSVWSL